MSDLFNTDPKQLEMFNNYMQNHNTAPQVSSSAQQTPIPAQQTPIPAPQVSSGIKLERHVKPTKTDDFVFDTDFDFGSPAEYTYANDFDLSMSTEPILENETTQKENFDLRTSNTTTEDTTASSEFDLRTTNEPNGSTGLLMSVLLLILYFIILLLANKEQVYSMNVSIETFYILAPVAVIANAISYKTLKGKIGSILLIGVIILVLIQEYAV